MPRALLIGAMLAVATTNLAMAQASMPIETVRIAAGGRAQVNFIPLTLADRLGYFKAEGLNVEVFDYQAGSRSVEALVAGNVDLVTGAYEHTLLMQHRGVHIQALVLLARTYGLVIALSKEQAAKYRSPRDLKGLRIGVSAPGSTTALVLDVFLRKAGMTLDDVSVIAVGQSAAAVAAMKYGKIDGIVNPDPVITKLVNDGDAVAVLDSRTEQGAEDLHGGYLASSAVLTTPEFVARRPAAAQAFVNAMVRTLVWLKTASIEDIMAHLPPEYFAGDRELYRQALVANRRNYSEDGRITAELAGNTLALLKIGPLAGAGPLELGRTHVETFVERALKLY